MRYLIMICIMMLQIGLLKSQVNWTYSDNFSAKCLGSIKSASDIDDFISIQNDSIIISDSFEHQCCPKYEFKISEIKDDSIYIVFQDTTKLQCDCMCDFHVRLNVGKYESDKLKINYNGVWYSLNTLVFAPQGAEWYYTERQSFSGDLNYFKITSLKDSIINGKTCRIIQKDGNPMCSGRPDIEYMYEENSILHFWDTTFNRFQVLYDFNKAVGDFWIIEIKDIWNENNLDTIKVVVDAITSIKINDKFLRVLNVTYNVFSERHSYPYESVIIEKIGDTKYLFNYYPYSSIACDGNYADGLRCYSDSQIGSYSTGIVDSCTYTYTWVGLQKNNLEFSFNVFPNPTAGSIDIIVNSDDKFTAELIDFTGRLIKSWEFNSNTNIDLTQIQAGLYILNIKHNDKKMGVMKIIKK